MLSGRPHEGASAVKQSLAIRPTRGPTDPSGRRTGGLPGPTSRACAPSLWGSWSSTTSSPGRDRRLRRRRRLLRHLGLPHHRSPRARSTARDGSTCWVSRAPGATTDARRCRRPGRHLARVAAAPARVPAGRHGPAGRRQRALRAELVAGRRLGRLPHRRERALAGAALLVLVGRGAVLRPLAGPIRDRAGCRPADRLPLAHRGAAAGRRSGRGQPGILGGADRRERRRLFRDAHPCVGVGGRRHPCLLLAVRWSSCRGSLRLRRAGSGWR